jgi:hypothetical protein
MVEQSIMMGRVWRRKMITSWHPGNRSRDRNKIEHSSSPAPYFLQVSSSATLPAPPKIAPPSGDQAPTMR